jgi:hypothetical protein
MAFSTRNKTHVGGIRSLTRDPTVIDSERLRSIDAQIKQLFIGSESCETMNFALTGTHCAIVDSVTFVDASAGNMTVLLPDATPLRTQSHVENGRGLLKVFVMTTAPGAFTCQILPDTPATGMDVTLDGLNQTALYMWESTGWVLIASTGTSASAPEPLWETLLAGNTTYGAGLPAGASMVGLGYRLDLEPHAPFALPGIYSANPAAGADGEDFEIVGDACTGAFFGGDVRITGGGATTGTGGGVAISGANASAAGGSGGPASLSSGLSGGGNGSGGGINIQAGQGSGTGPSGNIFISANGPNSGSATGTSINLTTGGSTTGAAGKITCLTADTGGAGAPGRITTSCGRNTVTGENGTHGLIAAGATFACHYAVQQQNAPTVSAGVGALAAGSSDTCGGITGVQAGAVGCTIAYRVPWAVGVVPWVVASMVGATAGTVTVSARTNTGFQVVHGNVGGPADINYIAMGPTHTL